MDMLWQSCDKSFSTKFQKLKKEKKMVLFQLSLFYMFILSIMLGPEYRLINALNTLECKYISKTGCMSYHNIFTLFLN